MDKYLKLFQDMRPLLLSKVGGLTEAENWLMRIKKFIDGMACLQERRVTLITFAFKGEVKRWWQSQLQENFGRQSSYFV